MTDDRQAALHQACAPPMQSLVLLLLTLPTASASVEDSSGQGQTGRARALFNTGQRSCRIGQCGPGTITLAVIWLLITLYGCSVCARTYALGRDRTITQFYHSAWLARDGAPSQINAIAQTTDGYLWFGSARGLFQFDSAQFKLYEPPSGDRFPSNNINALMATPDGGLWISFNPYGVGFLKSGRFFLYDQPRFALTSFVRDVDGRIWAGSVTGLLLLNGSDWTEIGSRWNFTGHRIWTMFVDRSGTLWVATDDTLTFLRRGSNQFQKTGTHVSLGVIRIAQAGNGQLWFSQYDHPLKTMDDQGRILKSPSIQLKATNFLFDRDGSFWMVGFLNGVGRLRFPESLANRTVNGNDPELEWFKRDDGLTDNEVNNVFEDREGNIWVTSSEGVNRFRYSYFIPAKLPPPSTYLTLVTASHGGFWIGTEVGAPFRRISENDSSFDEMPVSARISSVYQESKDTVWWGGRDGIYRQKSDRFDFFRIPRQVPSDWIWELFPDDRNGGLWVSSGDYGLIHFRDGVWTFPPRPESLPDFGPSASFHETAGRTWLGYRDGRVFLLTREAIRAYSRNDGLDIGRIRVIRGHGSQMFFGGEIGLAVLENGRFTTIRAAGVRALGAVTGIVEAGDGSVWLNEQHGVVRISPSDILQLAKDPDHIVQPQFYDFLDGLPGAAQTQFRSSTAIQTSDGRLWFATDNGLAWVDPAHMLRNTLPPPVIITSLSADSNRYAASDEIRLPKGTTTVRFEYTALSFSIPERVRFRYVLQDVDQSWHDAGNLREAVYNNLGPGPYRFRVIAANNDGVWNNAGATISFSIAPLFYQTTWFRALCVAIFLILLWIGYQFRLRQIQHQFNIGLEARVHERTRIINTIPALAWSAGRDGAADFFNQRWVDYTGLSAEQSCARGWMSAIHPDDLKAVADHCQSSLASGKAAEVEARVCRRDGAYRWFLFRIDPLRDKSGTVIKLYGTITDIEDNKRLEETLRANELSLRQIVDNIPGFVHTTSAMGEIEFLSRQTLEFFGKTREQLKDWSRAGIVHPDDLPHTIEAWRKSIETGQDLEVEHRNRRVDGVYRWIQARGRAVRNQEGEINAWYWLLTDIDDRKKAEEALRVNERNLSLIVDSIPGLVARTSPAGEVEVVNRPLLEYFGKDLEEIRNWQFTDAIYPDDLPLAIETFNNLSAGHPFDVEQRLRRFDGEYRWFQSRGLPLRDLEGRILNWYVLLTDIEDRKKAEEALESNERNLGLIINTMPILAWSARPDGSAEFLNQHYLDYVGLPLEKLQGWGWTTAVHPEDLDALSGAWQSIMSKGKLGEAEARLRRFDGEYRWFLLRTNPMRDESGHIVKWYGTNTDIHDRKRAEAEVKESYLRLAEAQRLSKTGSFITDLVADNHSWSEETFRIFEFDSRTKVTVQMIRNGIHPEDLPSFDSMIARAMTGKDVDFSFRFVTSQGALKHIRGMARVIEHIVGQPLFIGALQDVTDSKIAEEALNRARSDLAHVSRVTTLNALTASIAHEINQPLTGIVTNANTCLWLLSTDPPDVAGARETAQLTIRDGNRAADVIERLRGLYGKKDSRPETMNLNEATQEVISLSLSDLQRNRVIVHQELADDLPPITGDKIQLQQVILNLIRNASDAMSKIDDRPRELLITTERDKNNWVCLGVKDVGVGFPAHSADKLFEAFYTTKEHGMGIGLNVSRSIIEAHHGRLWAMANDGPGATFWFSIPCSVAGAGGLTPVVNGDATI